MSLDFEVRKAAALWALTVSTEAPETPNHAPRILLAKRICEDIAPRDGGLDILSNIILLTMMFASVPEPETSEVTLLLETILGVFMVVGAFQ